MGTLVRLLLLVALIGSIALLWLQNQQPISLTMFGFYRTPQLSLSIWLLLFTLAGVITSLLWQLLLSFPSPSRPKKVKRKTYIRDEVETAPQPESEWGSTQKTPEPWDNINPPPPPQPEPPKQEEISPPPESPQITSTYSYSYAKASPQQKKNSTDQVYDAPYRVITPPYQDKPSAEPEQEEDQEDWV